MTDGPGIRASYHPIEYLEAELVAAPFSSIVSFQNSITTLDSSLRHSGTLALWREIESSLLARFPGTSIDELVSRRDRRWFPRDGGQSQSLINVLANASREIIASAGGIGLPRVQVAASADGFEPLLTAAQLRRLWRWLTFALPSDLLLAAANVGPDSPATLSPNLSLALAERGYAETHLHIGAAIPFDVLWSATHFELARSTATERMFASPGAEFDQGRQIGNWLIRSAICRPVLAAFLMSAKRGSGLVEFFRNARPRLERRFGVLVTRRIFLAMSDLRNGKMGPSSSSFGFLRNDFATMIRVAPDEIFRIQLDQIRDLDPVSEWFPTREGQSPDFQFSKAAFDYLRTTGSGDKLFSRLFWQVVRLRVAFYRHVVQRPLTPGLQWFVRAFSRLSSSKQSIAIEAFIESAAKSSGRGLRSLEFRTTPMPHMSDLNDFVQRVDRTAKKLRASAAVANSMSTVSKSQDRSIPGPESLEVGIVFHFARSRGDGARDGAPAAWAENTHSAPKARANTSGYRFSGFYIRNRAFAASLANLITTFPRTLEIVRGVDLCSDEMGIPLWAMRGLLEHVTTAAARAAQKLPVSSRPFKRPMRLTVHAGEDFVHLLGGIRRVGEVIEFVPLGEGDRIGHGLALGVNPHSWANLVHSVPVTLEERLLDLTWAWRLAMRPSSLPELKSWIPWLREQLESLSQRIFNDERPASPADLDKFQRGLHTTRILKQAGFPSGPRPQMTKSKTVDHVIRWLTDRSLFNRAQELDIVDVRSEVPLVLAAQRQVRLDIGQLGISVEVNPSSNLLIGHLGSLKEHPLWRLNPPRGSDAETPPVRICIGTDDPITFATSLENEYQLVFDAMTEAGLSADECDAWINKVRQTSLDSRFTLPRSNVDLMLPMSLDRSPLLL